MTKLLLNIIPLAHVTISTCDQEGLATNQRINTEIPLAIRSTRNCQGISMGWVRTS